MLFMTYNVRDLINAVGVTISHKWENPAIFLKHRKITNCTECNVCLCFFKPKNSVILYTYLLNFNLE